MKYLFIVNPAAGMRDESETVVPVIESEMRDSGLDWSVVMTESPGHAGELARAAGLSGEPTRICACGGDGTLCETVNGAFGFDNLEHACWPCGSGNDFIKCYGEASAFRDAKAVVNSSALPMDAIRVNGSFCFNLLSVGIDADVNYATERWRRLPLFRGRISYDMALVECLLRPMGKKMRLKIDDKELEGTYMLAAAGNGKVYGGGYMATPEARPDDGIIDVVTVGKIPLSRVIKLLDKYKKGEHIVNGEVVEELEDCMNYYRATSMSIECDEEFTLNVDGESLRVRRADITMLPHSWKFVVPDDFV